MFTYTSELQLQMPHIVSHRAVIVDRMTADGEMRMRECEGARMRGCEDASRSHDVERMRSSSCGDLDSGVACLGRNTCDPFDQEIPILRSTDVAEQGDVVAIEGGGSWGCGS